MSDNELTQWALENLLEFYRSERDFYFQYAFQTGSYSLWCYNNWRHYRAMVDIIGRILNDESTLTYNPEQ